MQNFPTETCLSIEEICLMLVGNELLTPFVASSHASRSIEHILVRARSGEHVGWGECPTLAEPFYLEETTKTAWHVLEDFLVPAVLGPSLSLRGFRDRMAAVKGNTFAKSGLELALWDLFARAEGWNIAAALGGTRSEVLSGVSLGLEDDTSRLLDRIEAHVSSGYRRVKLKVARSRDTVVLERVRHRFPDLPLMVDANGDYTLADLDHLKAFDAFGLSMIEQPLGWDDLVEHAILQSALRTPICLDESIRSVADAKSAIALGSCKVINVKIGRVGGLFEAKEIHDLALGRGIPLWCGGMHDFGVSRAACVALSTLPGFSLPGDISGSDKYFAEDIVTPPIVAHRGAITPRPGVAFGHDVDEAAVGARTISERTFRA